METILPTEHPEFDELSLKERSFELVDLQMFSRKCDDADATKG